MSNITSITNSNFTPNSTQQLMARAKQIAGLSIDQIYKNSHKEQINMPTLNIKDKGIIGKLLERYLGANASNKAEPDFVHLGIELKTIPIDHNNNPCETTYVCRANINHHYKSWHTSLVKRKLSHVLWIPIEGNTNLALEKRKVGYPILWQPSPQQLAILKQDWLELTEFLNLGKASEITAKYGTYLQLRPKADNCSNDMVEYVDHNEHKLTLVNKGFYLRKNFTRQILS